MLKIKGHNLKSLTGSYTTPQEALSDIQRYYPDAYLATDDCVRCIHSDGNNEIVAHLLALSPSGKLYGSLRYTATGLYILMDSTGAKVPGFHGTNALLPAIARASAMGYEDANGEW